MIREALNGAATEVHIEPLSDRGRVRYRINDTLEERDRLPLRVMEPLMRYIKRMGHLAMDVKRIPQSGTAEVNVDGRRMKLTLDLVPSQHGQSMVIHLPPAANKGNGLISHVKNLFGRHVNRQSDDADRASIAALRAVLLRQAAEGSFTWDGGMETLLPPGIDVAALRNTMGIEVEAMGTAHPAPPAVIDTALVLLTFRTAFGARAALWERAAIKAMRFIADAIHGHVYEIRPWLDRCQRKLTETTPASAPTT